MIREAISQGAAALRGNPLRASLGALAFAVAVATTPSSPFATTLGTG